MFRTLPAPPAYCLDLANHGGLHSRIVERSLKRRAAVQLMQETVAECVAEGAARTAATKRARKQLAVKPAPLSNAERERRQAQAESRKEERQRVRDLAQTRPELFLIRSPRAPSVADMNRFAEARLAVAAGVPCEDPFMKVHLVCSPRRDGDATTRAVREVQAGAEDSDADCDALWLACVARVAFGTERFVRRLGLQRPASFEQFVEACVGAALAVAAEGFHACTDAYTAGRLGWNDERAAWRMGDDAAAAEYLREKHTGRREGLGAARRRACSGALSQLAASPGGRPRRPLHGAAARPGSPGLARAP